MNIKLLFVLSLHLLFLLQVSAQVTPPCPTPPPPGAEACQTTCVYCDFDGYMGINNGTPSGGNTVCGQISIHNDQWFGFVAGTESIVIDILTSNCLNGDGLQAAFFDNCAEDALVCNGGSGGGAGQPLILSYDNFVPGQTYYLMIDGWTADVCNFEIDVLSGSITPPAPGQPQQPLGPSAVCPGATVEYTIPPVEGAGFYLWTSPAGSSINGGTNSVNFPAPEGTTVTITFGTAGGNVCVRVGNACFPPVQTCLFVSNQPIPPTIKPDVVICYDELPFVWDEAPFTTLSLSGTFNLLSTPYDSYLGCDSSVRQRIIVKPIIQTNIGTQFICEGQCLNINDNLYCNTGGPFQELFESWQGCDSIVTFTVIRVPAAANISGLDAIDCSSPILTLGSAGSSTGANVTYSWSNATWNVIGSQSTQNINSGGIYHLVVVNTGGVVQCRDTAQVTVIADITPPGATASGGIIGCLVSNQNITLMGGSTASGINYQWTGPGITPANQFLQNPTVSTAGTYTLVVTNPVNNCTSSATAMVVNDNTPPNASASGGTLNCTILSVQLTGSSSVPNPAYLWTGPGITPANNTQASPNVGLAGNYTVTITNNANGCTNTASAVVVQDVGLPTVSAGTDQIINCNALSVTLNGSGNAGGAPTQFLWTGPGITPVNQNQQTPSVNTAGLYVLTLTNNTNNCSRTDTVQVTENLLLPTVSAGLNRTINCDSLSVTLIGSGSSQGANFQALWTGPGITPANNSQYNPTVNLPGNYTLLVTNTINGCTANDDVTVVIDQTAPVANAGTDDVLTCTSTNGVTLNGSGTPAGVLFQWTGPGIGANNENLPNPTVTIPGNYTLEVTNPVNGCTDTDMVVVSQDANVPDANAGPDLELNCTVASVDIDGSGSSSGPGIIYQWSGPGINGGNAGNQSPTGLVVPGTYNITVTNTNNSCSNTDVVVIIIDTIAPNVSAGPDQILNCFNGASDTLSGNGSSTGAGFTLLWSGPGITGTNQNSLNPIVDQAGNYLLVVTNTGNNCTANDQTVVSNDLAAPTADAGADAIIDCVTTSTTIGGNSSGGPEFTYVWIGPGINAGNANLAQPTVADDGFYNLVVTDTSNGCSATDDITVTLNAVYPTASAGADQTITCTATSVVLDGSGASSGPEFVYTWTGPGINGGNAGQQSPSVGADGVYMLSVQNTDNSCVTNDTVVVDINQTLPVADAPAQMMLDCQTTSVVLDGSGTSTGSNFIQLWTGPDIHAGNENDVSPLVTLPGAYILLVTDMDNGCTATDNSTVLQDIVDPVASTGSDLILTCLQNIQAIDGSGSSSGPDYGYVWQGPGINSGNFNQQNPMVADSGSYTLLVTNSVNHCTATDVVYVALDGDFPISEAGADPTLTCVTTVVTLDGTQSQSGAGIQYTWTGPGVVAGTETNVSASADVPGLYTLTVLNTNNGCSKTDVVTVNEDILFPTVNAGTNQTLTCANPNGVTLSSSGSDVGANFNLLWSGPGITPANETQADPTVLVAGAYTLLITSNVNGCSDTDNVVVNQDQDLPQANAGADQLLNCTITDVTLTGSNSGPLNEITFLWTGPGIDLVNENDVSPVVSLPGIYSLVVNNTITGCQATDNVEVTIDNEVPQITVNSPTISCTQPSVALTATSSLPGSSYSWSGPGISGSNPTTPTITVSIAGSFTVTVTAPNGCSNTANVVVTVDASVPNGNTEGTTLNCFNNGQSTISGNITSPGATGTWMGPGGFTSDSLTTTVTVPGNYVLVITSANGCTKMVNTQVLSDFTAPTALVLVNDLLDCSTTQVTVNASGSSTGNNFTYVWMVTGGGNIVSGANSLTPVADAAGNYMIVITNTINGCTSSAAATVTLDPEVPTGFDLSVLDIRCYGESNGIVLVNNVVGGTGPFSFAINGGNPVTGNQFTQLTAGEYLVSLEDANGCIIDTLVSIEEPDELIVELGEDVTVQLGEEATVQAQLAFETPIQTVSWNTEVPCDNSNCLEFTYVPDDSRRYILTVTDENGCTQSDFMTLIVRKDRLVYVPNIFNPESDDPLNALLMIFGGTGVVKINNWMIFDRWGGQVFERTNFLPNDPASGWDGKIKGDEGQSSVYVWVAEIEFIDGVVEIFKGDVTLIRQ